MTTIASHLDERFRDSALLRDSAQFHDTALLHDSALGKRRIMAVVLPQLLPELALTELSLQTAQHGRSHKSFSLSSLAFAVVVTNSEERKVSEPESGWLPGLGETSAKEELQPKTRIDAVSHRARQFGVRPGQSVAEARALLSELQFCELPGSRVRAALARVADSLSRFASIVSFDEAVCVSSEPSRGKSGTRPAPSSNQRTRNVGTVWLDITGIGHLFGGEKELSREVVNTVQTLGHRVRVAVANGPVLAQALACWPTQDQTIQVLSDEQVKAAVRWLPITALPVDAETQTWLARLGVLTFADLEKIPRHLTASRLSNFLATREGKSTGTSRVLDLLQGKDDEPLKAYVPQALPVESVTWDDPVTGSEPLLFALRGLVAKVCARLDGRGLAARRMRVTVTGDRAVARFHAARVDWHTEFELVTPLYRADELWKVMSSRVSRASLETPSVGLRLEVLELATRQERQLSLASADTKLEGASPEKMAVLFGTLAAEIGQHHFGVLKLIDSHRPERRSVLQPIEGLSPVCTAMRGKRTQRRAGSAVEVDALQGLLPGMDGRPSNDVVFGEGEVPPTRLLEPPLPIEELILQQPALQQPALQQPVLQQPVLQQPAALEGDAAGAISQPPPMQPSEPLFESRDVAFEVGESLRIESEVYSIEKVDFVHRIDGVEWWSKTPASRDYFRVWLKSVEGRLGRETVSAASVDVLVFVDRSNGKRYVHGFYD